MNVVNLDFSVFSFIWFPVEYALTIDSLLLLCRICFDHRQHFYLVFGRMCFDNRKLL